MNWYIVAWKKFTDFKGRATRSEYWYFVLFNFIVTVLLSMLDLAFGLYDIESNIGVLSGLYSVVAILPGLAVGTRRLHDIDRSGWWQLMVFIPVIGTIVLAIMFMLDSKEDNEYGRNSKQHLVKR